MLIWCCSWLITPTDSPQFRVKPGRPGSGGVVVSHLDSYHKPTFLSMSTVSLHLSGGTACERELEESGVTERWRWAKAQRGGSRCAQLLGRSEGFWFSQLSCKIRQIRQFFYFIFFFCLIYWGSDAFHFTPLSRHCTSLLPPFQTPIIVLPVISTQDQEMDGRNASPCYWA